MWEVTFQRSLSHTAPPLSSSSRRRRRRYPFFRDRDESTLSKTHYKLDKLVVSSKCALLLLLPLLPCHTPPQPQGRLSSLARPLHSRVTTLKRGPSRPPWILAQRMELGVPRNGDFTAGSSLSPLDDTAQADILYRSIADLYCSTYCVVLLLLNDDGAIPSWSVESGELGQGERSPLLSLLRLMFLFRGSKMKKSLNFRH